MSTLPIALTAADPRVVRPRDLAAHYRQPAKEFARLEGRGVLLRLARGYYALVPEELRGTRWRPSIEAAAVAIAQSDYGREGAAAMSVSAARLLGAIPRAIGTGVVAVGHRRPTIDTAVGRVLFVQRELDRLDIQRVRTELSTGLVTTPEQTVLDLADRPELGALPTPEVEAAIRQLAVTVDWALVGDLAAAQHKRPAAVLAARAAEVAAPIRASHSSRRRSS